MRHALFLLIVAVYTLAVGQNWGSYAAALMIAAWVRHRGQLATRIAPQSGRFPLEVRRVRAAASLFTLFLFAGCFPAGTTFEDGPWAG